MEEYSRMISSIKSAVQQRAQKKAAYINALADFDARQNAYRKLVGVPGKETEAKKREEAVERSREIYSNAKAEHEKTTERLLIEFESFKAQRTVDMKEIMVDFVSLQVSRCLCSCLLLPSID
jgi:ERCC4-type nuclease